jgi:4-hydroxy-3-methylbut-2-en-1-yl diphosphate reductase
MKIEIDQNSGYCFGVEFAIEMAEDTLKEEDTLYCLGDIVHNGMEVNRLQKLGLIVIDHEQLKELKDCKVLIRAHGEPPETYQIAMDNSIELIDASCPVVLKLQNRVKNAYNKSRENNGQIVIYGKKGHAEVIGLTGQTREDALVVMVDEDLDEIDYSRPITLFSQTTKSTKGFYSLKQKIEDRVREYNENKDEVFKTNDSICRQVSNREPQLLKFSGMHDVILFVSGKKSSNGMALYQVCKSCNEKSYFIENEDDLQSKWFESAESVGICGATSTPMWLMENIRDRLLKPDFQTSLEN